MKIAFNTMEEYDNRPKGSVGSSMIRANWLIKYWKDAELYQIGKKYDVMIYQKVYWSEMVKRFKGIQILDLCDPDWLEGKPVMEYVRNTDATVTSTQNLADYIKKFAPDKPVIYIKDRVDLDEYKYRKNDFKGNIKNVVWYGFSNNFHYLHPAIPTLIEKNISLTVISNQSINIPSGFKGLIMDNIKYKQDMIIDNILKFDAVLLPDPAKLDLRGRFKSNNKDIQMWAIGMPVIKSIDDLERLMSPEQRRKESEKNRKKVEKEYNVKLSVEEYKKLICKLKK